jgi:hypothetical protein
MYVLAEYTYFQNAYAFVFVVALVFIVASTNQFLSYPYVADPCGRNEHKNLELSTVYNC